MLGRLGLHECLTIIFGKKHPMVGLPQELHTPEIQQLDINKSPIEAKKSFCKTLLLGSICQSSGVVHICFCKKNKNLGAGFRFLNGSYSAENQHFVWEFTVAKWFMSFIESLFRDISSIFGCAYCILLINTTGWRVLDDSSLIGWSEMLVFW